MTVCGCAKFVARHVVGLALLCGGAPAAIAQEQAAADPWADARRQFQAAYALADSGGADTPDADGAALRAYPLYPYLEAARLQRDARLAAAAQAPPVDARIAGFLKRHGDEPVGRTLRRAWLPELAKRKAWELYLAQYAAAGAEADAALRCDALQARIALQRQQGLAQDITSEWLSGRDSPAECEPAFNWLRLHHLLVPALIDQRARLALAAGNANLARGLARTLPPEMAAPLKQWLELIEQPERAIDTLIDETDRPVESAALQDGWLRLARANPDSALQRFEPLLQARHLDGAAASPYARSLALALAWSRRPQALEYFARVDAADLDQRSAEWLVRAALWAGDWARAAQAIAALPQQRELPRWRYWAARAAERQGDAAAARSTYEALLPGDNYYASAAAARLGVEFAPHPQPLAFNPATLAQLAQRPALVRAHELLLCDFKPLAASEWLYGLEGLDGPSRIQAAGLAQRWNWYEQAIATAARQGIFDDYQMLYPLPYDAPLHAAAEAARLPETLLYAMLRQESLYDAETTSRAGALGLLQLLPETAQRTARRWQRPPPSRADLFNPEVSLGLGAAYLRDLLDLFGGQVPVAVAAYNAGANAATRWLPEQPKDTDVWIENIPYNETRDYVQRILWHKLVFDWRRSGKPQRLDAVLGQVTMPEVAPKAAAAEPQ